jgi:glycogen synthase
MRICLYTNTALPRRGGQEYVVDTLARGLVKADCHVVVLAPVWADHHDDRDLPYQVARHPRFISTHRLVDPYAFFLRHLHRRHRFDLVHGHGIYPTGYLATRLGIPAVLTSHDGPTSSNPQSIRRPIIHTRFCSAIRRATALVAVNDLTRGSFLQLGVDATRIVDIPQGFAPELLCDVPVSELPPGLHSRRFILYLGRLVKQKGVDILLDAFARQPWRQQGMLVIAGGGVQEEALRQRASTLGIAQRVVFTGWIQGRTKVALLQHALCTVAPSRKAESFCLSALESHAAGTPAIVCNVAGLRERVEPDVTGWRFEPESPATLASALQTVWEHPDQAITMGHVARDKAQAYNWTHIVEQHIRLYDRLIPAKTPIAKGNLPQC